MKNLDLEIIANNQGYSTKIDNLTIHNECKFCFGLAIAKRISELKGKEGIETERVAIKSQIKKEELNWIIYQIKTSSFYSNYKIDLNI